MDNESIAAAVANYEQRRQEVVELTRRRNNLILSCENEEFSPGTMNRQRDICLKVALADLRDIRGQNPYDGYTYGEILDNNHAEGRCCQNCYDSYQIKTGPLAEARQKLGNAKRSLSMIGKNLLKKQEQANGS